MELPEIFTGTPTPSKWAALGEYLRSGGIRSGPGLLMRKVGNQVILSNRRRGAGSGGGGAPTTCFFGELTTYPVGGVTKTGIRGGTIQAGIKNFNVPNKELNLASTGVTLFYLEIAVTANNDDAGEILLPGIETSTETTPSGFWKSVSWTAEPVTQYPANTRPIVTTGVGKIIIPIGKLTIAAGAATLEAVGCGNITINHCGGTLTAARG
jgi:hypothetical protein